MQVHAAGLPGALGQAAAAAAPVGLPPGLLGHPGAGAAAAAAAAAAGGPGGLPASLLGAAAAGAIPTSLAQAVGAAAGAAGPHPAFASLLAQQKPAVTSAAAAAAAASDSLAAAAAAAAAVKSREEELKRTADTNGGIYFTLDIFSTNITLQWCTDLVGTDLVENFDLIDVAEGQF